MNGFSKKFSSQTSSFGTKVMEVATTTLNAANTAFTAGLQTCDEKGTAKVLGDAELRVSPQGEVWAQREGRSPNSRGGSQQPAGVSSGAVVISRSGEATATTWGTTVFDLRLEMEASGCLVARGSKNGVDVPLRCRWRRKICDVSTELSEVSTNVYQISADDIGCSVLVEATPSGRAGMEPNEKAYGEAGPFEMNAATRRCLENYLASGSATIPTRMPRGENPQHDSSSSDGNFRVNVSSDEVAIMISTGTAGSNSGFSKRWSREYSAQYPMVIIDRNSLTNFELRLGEGEADHFRLVAMSRSERDLTALAIRCFHAKKKIFTEAVVDKISRDILARSAEAAKIVNAATTVAEEESSSSDSNNMSPDLFVMIQRLVREINAALEKEEKLARDKKRAILEKEALEQDITATIEAYQQLLLSYQKDELGASSQASLLNTSSSAVALDITARAAVVADLESKLHDSQSLANKYSEELALLRRDYRSLEKKRRAEMDEVSASRASALQATSEAERQKIGMLEEQVANLTKTNTEISLREQENQRYKSKLVGELEALRARALEAAAMDMTGHPLMISATERMETLEKEVSRLRKELEEATFEKKSLAAQSQALQADNKELSQNFLYIKEKYDSLKNQQVSTDELAERKSQKQQREWRKALDKIEELEKELDFAQKALDSVGAEKNRLFKKTESLSKDLAKSLSDLKASSERLSETNSLLLKSEKSKKMLEKSAESDQKVQSTSLDDLAVPGSAGLLHGGRLGAESHSIAQLEMQLREKDNVIKQLRDENATLKSRVRKLAAI